AADDSHLSRLRPVAEEARDDRDGLPGHTGHGDHNGVTAVVLAETAEAHTRDRDFDLTERLSGARYPSGDGCRLLSVEQGRERHGCGVQEGDDPTIHDRHVPSREVWDLCLGYSL